MGNFNAVDYSPATSSHLLTSPLEINMQLPPTNRATPWHPPFFFLKFILKLRKGSFIAFPQEEIFLISQASIQLHNLVK